jgi:hypothetical protein
MSWFTEYVIVIKPRWAFIMQDIAFVWVGTLVGRLSRGR